MQVLASIENVWFKTRQTYVKKQYIKNLKSFTPEIQKKHLENHMNIVNGEVFCL